MKIYEIILIGIALAMDAFALTIANCTTYKKSLNKVEEWSMPTAFAVFQFIMPVIGFYIGSIFAEYIVSVAKYVTAGVFFILSLKIVIDNIKEMKEKEIPQKKSDFTLPLLLLQGILTSIDALIVGVTFSVQLSFSIFLASLIIGVITFLIVTVALFCGKYLGKVLGKYATWLGAVILFGLSVKSLIEAIIG